MSSPISICLRRGNLANPPLPALNPVDSMNKETTPETFAAICSQSPWYKWISLGNLGDTALHKAVKCGNIPMIELIARNQIGVTLLNLGDIEWYTPLFRAIQCNQRTAARALIHLGADVNVQCRDYKVKRSFPDPQCLLECRTFRTPLSFTIEGCASNFFSRGLSKEIVSIQKVAMVKLLLIHNATLEPQLTTDEGIEILRQAEEEIDATKDTLFQQIADSTPADPETIKTIVSYVPLDEIPNIPEIPLDDWIVGDTIKLCSYAIQ